MMKLVEFSVTNYRSITVANKIKLHDFTVLVGKNNEGKSNLLNALNVAMMVVRENGYIKRAQVARGRYKSQFYDWERDFPVQFQGRTRGLESIFKLEFQLNEMELVEFQKETKIRGNEAIPITVRIGRDNIPKLEVPKKGSSSYKEKSTLVTKFISERIYINYIQAVRTEQMALRTLKDVIDIELMRLDDNSDYRDAVNKIYSLRQTVLDDISDQLLAPMKVFLPNLKDIKMEQTDKSRFDFWPRTQQLDIILDDGVATSIDHKGDGIKSLVTLAILKERSTKQGASLIAIEEPESHLHSGAIHNLVEVIKGIAKNNQVIISTHNPLFVQQNSISSNIIINEGDAHPAKNISEIRSILGVWPSDNLKNARFVLVVEGEEDRVSLIKILPLYSDVIKKALLNNQLVIKSLGGASNLVHDLADLQHSMCNYVVLLDNDKAGSEAAKKALSKGLLKTEQLRQTICNGMSEAEFEDCLNPEMYILSLEEKYNITIRGHKEFKTKKKWSDRLKNVFLDQGIKWSAAVEFEVKAIVAGCIPENGNLDKILIPQKSGFISGLVSAVEKMVSDEMNNK
ncbi:Predicted ATPase [Lachnospiraceae bacterium C7]|nr:Predicted ATPase [Lachnospiraceae bacterium C7]